MTASSLWEETPANNKKMVWGPFSNTVYSTAVLYQCYVLWTMWYYSYSRIIRVIVNKRMPIWCQGVGNNHKDVQRSRISADNYTITHSQYMYVNICAHDDGIKWKHFPRYLPFVWGIHRSPVNSPHKGQWREALMFSLIWALNKQSWGWWFETVSRSLWRRCNGGGRGGYYLIMSSE